MRTTREPRRSAKTVITDMVSEWIKRADNAQDPETREMLCEWLMGAELIATRMGWIALEAKLRRWRADNLRSQVLTSTPQPLDDQTNNSRKE